LINRIYFSPDCNGNPFYSALADKKIEMKSRKQLQKNKLNLKMKKIIFLLPLLTLLSCYDAEHNCKDFKTGKFKFEFVVDGVKKTTVFERKDGIEIETFEGKTDTSTVRWVSDCEYILQKKHPKNMAEEKAISMKILTTSKDSYTFEFGMVGSDQKQRGKVVKLD
jgi:hypothetical protein